MERNVFETIVRKRSGEPSAAVVTAVAEARGVDPVDLDCRLTDAVGPDAPDSLFSGDRCRSSTVPELEFSLGGRVVTAHGDESATETETAWRGVD